jgi:preprotein translocase subunit SecE
MIEQAEKGGSTIVDTAKLVLAIATLLAGIAGYYWFAEVPTAARILMVLAGLGIGAAFLFWSQQGQVLWAYIQGSRVELR